MGELVPFPDRKAGLAPDLMRMFCAGCGADRTVPPTAADPGPCPAYGSTTRSSCRPSGGAGPLLRVSGLAGPVDGVFGHVGAVTYGLGDPA